MNRQEKAALARISRNKKALPFGTLNRPAAQSAVDNMSQSPVESISAQTGLPALHHPTGEPSHPKDSGFGRVRPLHGYWDSPEIASDSHDAFPKGDVFFLEKAHCPLRSAAHIAHLHRLFICRHYYMSRLRRCQANSRKNRPEETSGRLRVKNILTLSSKIRGFLMSWKKTSDC